MLRDTLVSDYCIVAPSFFHLTYCLCSEPLRSPRCFYNTRDRGTCVSCFNLQPSFSAPGRHINAHCVTTTCQWEIQMPMTGSHSPQWHRVNADFSETATTICTRRAPHEPNPPSNMVVLLTKLCKRRYIKIQQPSHPCECGQLFVIVGKNFRDIT